MGLRDPLVTFDDNTQPDAYLARALLAAQQAGGSGRLRLEVGDAFALSTGRAYVAVSLWVERGAGRSESWQRVTGSIMGDSYADILALVARALDTARSLGRENVAT